MNELKQPENNTSNIKPNSTESIKPIKKRKYELSKDEEELITQIRDKKLDAKSLLNIENELEDEINKQQVPLSERIADYIEELMETVSHLDFIFERHNELNLKIASKLIPVSVIKDYKNSFNEVITKLKEKASNNFLYFYLLFFIFIKLKHY